MRRAEVVALKKAERSLLQALVKQPSSELLRALLDAQEARRRAQEAPADKDFMDARRELSGLVERVRVLEERERRRGDSVEPRAMRLMGRLA